MVFVNFIHNVIDFVHNYNFISDFLFNMYSAFAYLYRQNRIVYMILLFSAFSRFYYIYGSFNLNLLLTKAL